MSKQEKIEFQQERFVSQQQQTREQMQIQSQQLSVAPINIETLSQSSESSIQSSVKSRKQLEMERDEMIKQTILQYQKESSSMAQRIKEEEAKRMQSIQTETLRIEEEYKARQEATKRVEEERKRKLEEEKRQAEEKQRLKVQEMQRSQELRKLEAQKKAEEESLRLKLQQEERLRLERQKQEERIKQEKQKKEEERQKMRMVAEKQFESKTDMKKSFRAVSASPQVTRRSDDVHGYGFGQVKTGHVMSTKISFFNKAASVEREISDTPEPKRRVVRFQGVDSPSLSPVQKPVIKTGDVAANVRGWTRKVKDHESQMQRQSPITVQMQRQSPITIQFKSNGNVVREHTPSPPLPPPPSLDTLHSFGLSASSYASDNFEGTDL